MAPYIRQLLSQRPDKSGLCQTDRCLQRSGNFLQILPRFLPRLQIPAILDIMTRCILPSVGLVNCVHTVYVSLGMEYDLYEPMLPAGWYQYHQWCASIYRDRHRYLGYGYSAPVGTCRNCTSSGGNKIGSSLSSICHTLAVTDLVSSDI